MNASEIRNKVRESFLDDPLCEDSDSETLFSDSEIYESIDTAQKELALETKMLRDYRTSSITDLTITANDEWVDLSGKVIEVKRARLLTPSKRKLTVINFQDLDAGSVNFNDYFNLNSSTSWEDETGTPHSVIQNMSEGALRLYPTPDAAGTMKIMVIRLPLTEVNESTKLDDLEFDSVWKNALVFGALKDLYLKQDTDESEGVDTARANFFDAKFEREIERAKRFRSEKQFKTGGTTRYGGLI